MSQMLTEIRQQPAALERTLRAEWKNIEKLHDRFQARRPKFIVLAARGTSDNAAQFGRYLFEISTGIPVSLAAPSILTLYNAEIDLTDSLVVAISQSGESTDTNYVLECARKHGALTVGITNEPGSTITRIAESTIQVHAGKERSVAATKTYTGQLLVLYMLAWALGSKIPADELRRLPDLAETALRLEPEIAARVERYRFMEKAIVVGRGLNYSNAFEFALKLMETCYVVAERFSAADLLHGPIAMVEASTPVFLFAPPGNTWPSIREMLDKLDTLRAEPLVITDRSNAEAIARGERTIVVPTQLAAREGMPEDFLTPIPYIVPAQLFAACLAEQKGLDPDHPRSLQKVTHTM